MAGQLCGNLKALVHLFAVAGHAISVLMDTPNLVTPAWSAQVVPCNAFPYLQGKLDGVLTGVGNGKMKEEESCMSWMGNNKLGRGLAINDIDQDDVCGWRNGEDMWGIVVGGAGN